MKVVVVGQAPGRRGDPFRPLEGGGVLRLLRWARVDLQTYLYLTERVNLFKVYPGKGDRFNARLARAKARALFPRLAGRKCVFLGRAVASAFGLPVGPGWQFTFWALYDPINGIASACTVLIPHPSGVSHFYNLEANRLRAGGVFRTALGLDGLRGQP